MIQTLGRETLRQNRYRMAWYMRFYILFWNNQHPKDITEEID